jgi:ribonuclease HII
MELPTFEKEAALGAEYLAVGVDEVGRGPLAGPVVAAAAWYKDPEFRVPEGREKDFALLRDSKKLSSKQREKAAALVHEFFEVGVGIIGPETIDRVNILQASFLAMKAAVTNLQKKLPREKPVYLFIDGNQLLPSYSGKQAAVVGGDSTVRSIAAASIVAKVLRDTLCEEYEALYPGYGFARHKGYGTKEHLDALKRLGATAVHRKSFRPVQLANPENVNKRFNAFLKPKR